VKKEIKPRLKKVKKEIKLRLKKMKCLVDRGSKKERNLENMLRKAMK